ncbi:aconitate hydratase AcnA [Oceanobacillus jeddahense]|uniref:aconitate hydratase AcnA n=1 Tax=Oceanobacillus jeddahense TaxID=1462527 RepID=UPI000A889561|nr:aconitate hydratase AcnA [Oceanobacillus jeddahense]
MIKITKETLSIKKEVKKELTANGEKYIYYSLERLTTLGYINVKKLPFSLKIWLESILRNAESGEDGKKQLEALANWPSERDSSQELPFYPGRVLLHDTTGLPALVDLAAMRDALKTRDKNPLHLNPKLPVDLVIDHSLIVESFGNKDALNKNEQREFRKNYERYQFLKWAKNSFQNLTIVPPSSGIMHQINMEYLSTLVIKKKKGDVNLLYPDTLVGTDSHTTMVNGMGIVAWGVGGIEGEAAILEKPVFMNIPKVLGVKLTNKLPAGTTSTDLALTLTNVLRKYDVVGKIVEFFGPGVQHLSVPDRATISNMVPEYGATMGYFPVDKETLAYMDLIGHREEEIKLMEEYYRLQGMYRENSMMEPSYEEILEFNLEEVVPSLAGPKRPQDKVNLNQCKEEFNHILTEPINNGGYGLSSQELKTESVTSMGTLKHGSVVLAAITSCTNTSNPDVMIAAGLVAKKAVDLGVKKKEFVKSSITPGSRVVADYLENAGLNNYLEKLGFYVSGYGCATCIGNSGSLPPEIEKAIKENQLVVSGVLSGNRNFEGRVHPLIKANYLGSPPIVVMYALAGTMNINLMVDPIAYSSEKAPIYFHDLWPSAEEVEAIKNTFLTQDLFKARYKDILTHNKEWNLIESEDSHLFKWDSKSTYIQKPPFVNQRPQADSYVFHKGRALLFLGDSVTTDHVSPSGAIGMSTPAGEFLLERGVSPGNFNSYPSRRGNHEVMVRGGFANVRLRNKLVPEKTGGYTIFFPTNEVMSVYAAAMQYQEKNTDLIVIAGKEYGTGSSRDWGAKAPKLLGVKAIIAESYERIHRSNLIGMGILPLQFLESDSAAGLGLNGSEIFTLKESMQDIQANSQVEVRVEGNKINSFTVKVRLDNKIELDYFKAGGIMNKVLEEIEERV